MRIPLRGAPRGGSGSLVTSGYDRPPVQRTEAGLDPLEARILDHTRRVARLRFVRARLADDFVRGKKWSSLGFVRVGDYSRERLGLAPRSIEEEASVARALERLPRTACAFLDGRISWTQLRSITTVAREIDEERWVETAVRTDTRSLLAKVREHLATSPAPPNKQSDDESSVLFSVRVSRRGRRLWRAARELAERSSGSRLSQAQVLELVAAEACGSAGTILLCPKDGLRSASDAESVLERCPFDIENESHRSEHPSPGEGEPAPEPSMQIPSPRGREPTLAERDPELAAFLAEIAAEKAAGVAEPALRPPGNPFREAERLLHSFLATIATEEGLPSVAPVESGQGPVDQVEALLQAIERRDPFALDSTMRAIGMAMRRADADLGRLLLDALNWNLHRVRGFRSFSEYVEATLDFCPRTAWTLIAVERQARRAGTDLLRAYRQGRLSLLAAKALLPVLSTRHAREWIDRASIVTLRRLEAEVAWTLELRDSTGDTELAPPALDERLPMNGASLLAEERVQMRARSETSSLGSNAVQMSVTISFHAPVSIVELAEDTLLAMRLDKEARGQAFERMLEAVLAEWLSVPRHRDPVFERDGWICAVPACSSRRDLHDHHVRFRSLGGDDNQDNRIAVCAAHHLKLIHTGRVRASGRAPDRIVWELGCRGNVREPMTRLVGDRYADRPAA